MTTQPDPRRWRLVTLPLERARTRALYACAAAIYDYDLPILELLSPAFERDQYGGCATCRAWSEPELERFDRSGEWQRHCHSIEHLAEVLGLDPDIVRTAVINDRHEAGERHYVEYGRGAL